MSERGMNMSTREKINNIMDSFTEEQLTQVLAMLGSIKEMLDYEAEDDEFCRKLAEDYLNDPDPHKHDSITLDDFVRELGLDPEELCKSR
jgi:hypothetical protein